MSNQYIIPEVGQGGGPVNTGNTGIGNTGTGDLSPTSAQNNMMVITLSPVNTTYNQSGVAKLEENGGQVKVTLDLNQVSGLDLPQPAHIHEGSCPDVGNVTYNLNDVVNGRSETTLNTTLSNLSSQFPLGINVHQSAADINTYTACGDLK